MSWWNPFDILNRHEKRLNDLHQALTSHVTANISRLDLVEKQQRDLSAVICTHKDENALQLQQIGKVVLDLDTRLKGHTWVKVAMALYRVLQGTTWLLVVVVGGAVIWKRPDSIPYIAQIFASALAKH